MGNLIYKRIYGNWTSPALNTWKKELLDNAIQPIQQYSNTVGKNSSDSALIIDAMDLLYQKRLDAFCIVSSDSDFTRLASRLRESEMFVLGMGEQKTPRAFISACNKFVYLDLLHKASANAAKGKRRKTAKRNRATKLPLSPQRVQPRQRPRKSKNPPKPNITTTKKRPRSTSLKLIRKSQSSKNAIPVVSTTSPTRIPTDLISSRWKPLCAKSPKSSAAMMAGSFPQAWEHVLPDACPTSTHATSALKSLYPSSNRSASSKAKA